MFNKSPVCFVSFASLFSSGCFLSVFVFAYNRQLEKKKPASNTAFVFVLRPPKSVNNAQPTPTKWLSGIGGKILANFDSIKVAKIGLFSIFIPGWVAYHPGWIRNGKRRD